MQKEIDRSVSCGADRVILPLLKLILRVLITKRIYIKKYIVTHVLRLYCYRSALIINCKVLGNYYTTMAVWQWLLVQFCASSPFQSWPPVYDIHLRDFHYCSAVNIIDISMSCIINTIQ